MQGAELGIKRSSYQRSLLPLTERATMLGEVQLLVQENREWVEEAQEDLERREKNANHKRTMHMWKNALEYVWNTRPIEHTQNLMGRMPKVMEAIIEAEGGKTKYWIQNLAWNIVRVFLLMD